MEWSFWEIITEKDRKKLRELMPKGWHPLDPNHPPVYDMKLEDSEELERIMKQKPHSPREVK